MLLVAESAGRRETLKDALRSVLGEITTVESFVQFQKEVAGCDYQCTFRSSFVAEQPTLSDF